MNLIANEGNWLALSPVKFIDGIASSDRLLLKHDHRQLAPTQMRFGNPDLLTRSLKIIAYIVSRSSFTELIEADRVNLSKISRRW